MAKQDATIEARTSDAARLEELYQHMHGHDINKAGTISALFLAMNDKLGVDVMLDKRTRDKAQHYQK